MRVPVVLLFVILSSACAAARDQEMEIPPVESTPVELPDRGMAPELTNETWLNTDHPLRLAELRGQVVLLEMWTYGCVNCQHVIPHIQDWYEAYHNQGLAVIGSHYPEFSYEQDLSNLKDAVRRWEINYPVTQDNDGRTWRAYNNHYWPTLYLIDKRGNLRYAHIGEGAYEQTEAAIQRLLTEPTT